MFSEMHIETITQDDRTYIDAHDLTKHLCKAMIAYAHEVKSCQMGSREEMLYAYGILAGMREIVLFLSQGVLEIDFEKSVNTLDDLIKFK